MSEPKRDVLAELEAMIAGLSAKDKAELVKLAEGELSKPWRPVPGPQADAYYSKADILLFGGASGGGKGLAFDTPIPTATGFTPIGQLQVGDWLFDETGKPCRVLAVSGINHRPCYRLTFDDGSVLVADDVHRWKTRTAKERLASVKLTEEWRARRRAKRPSRAIKNPEKPWVQDSVTRLNKERIYEYQEPPTGEVRSTLDILETHMDGEHVNHSIDIAGALDLPWADLPEEPYFFGCITARPIPLAYLRSSIAQRQSVLQGICDGRGAVGASGQIEIALGNKEFMDSVHELVLSLGIKAALTQGPTAGKDRYRLKFMAPFDAFRRADRLAKQKPPTRETTKRRYIVSIEPIESEPTVCIAVSSPSKLFLAGRSFIPTHNSSLLVGCAITDHSRSVIYRRAYADISGLEEELEKLNGGRQGYNSTTTTWRRGGRSLKFEALEKPNAEESAQGKARSFIGLDEGAQLTVAKVRFVMGWLRPSGDPNERCRMVIASNPPMGGEGDWMLEWFAPWLDPTFPNPAEPGELRWAYFKDDDTVWVDGPGKTVIGEEEYTHMSRTFIPSKVDDNPYLKDTGYKGRIQNLPEPMRSKLLYGDFLAGRQDHEWQVIPSEWLTEANNRWRRADPHKQRRMLALAADIALGGADNLVMARLHEENWFAPLEVRPGSEFGGATGSDRIASLLLKYRRDGADLSVDGTGGWAAGVRSHLAKDHETDCASIVFSKGSNAATRDGSLLFMNLRAEMYWKFREALDPNLGEFLALPPDPRLFAELTAQRYFIKSRGKDAYIGMEPKEKQPVSPDRADAVVMAWRRRNAWARKAAIKATQNKPMVLPVPAGPSSWMG